MIIINDNITERLPAMTENMLWNYPFDETYQRKILSATQINAVCFHNINNPTSSVYNLLLSNNCTTTLISADIVSDFIPDESVIGQFKHNLMVIDAELIDISETVEKQIKDIASNCKIPTIVLNAFKDEETYYSGGTSCLFTTRLIPIERIIWYAEKASIYNEKYECIENIDSLYTSNRIIVPTWDTSICSSFYMEFMIGNNNNEIGVCSIESDNLAYFACTYNKSKKLFKSYFLEERTAEEEVELKKGFNRVIITKKNNFITCYLNGKQISYHPYERIININRFIGGSSGTTLFASVPSDIYIRNMCYFNTDLSSSQIKKLSQGYLSIQ